MEYNQGHAYPAHRPHNTWLMIALLVLVGLLLFSEARNWFSDLYYAGPRIISPDASVSGGS
jgi:hypothetical protein